MTPDHTVKHKDVDPMMYLLQLPSTNGYLAHIPRPTTFATIASTGEMQRGHCAVESQLEANGQGTLLLEVSLNAFE